MLDPYFWNERYIDEDTPWDIGDVSPPLKSYLKNVTDKDTRILIPGAGNAYEAVYLHRIGFKHVHVCDWAASAFLNLKKQAPGFPPEHLHCQDFFTLTGEYDLILEQTFFCAIDPALRHSYAEKTASLLGGNGRLVGLLFASPFPFEGPPFGGTETEYRCYFQPFFTIEKMEVCQNSILPRAGNELFIQLMKKQSL
jgi:thiopurine S-methyltransferase